MAVALLIGQLSACSYPRYAPYEALELKTSAAPPGQVTAKFLGVTTILLDDGTTAIMTDGFFSRPPLPQMVIGQIGPSDERIGYALDRADASKLDALLVAHSHFDHALDSGRVAKRTGALLVGSNSTRNIGLGESLAPNRIKTIKNGDRFACGEFKITVLASPHAHKDRAPGAVKHPLFPLAHVSVYKEGGNDSFLVEHGGLNILIHPSATAQSATFSDVRADVVFLAIGMLGEQRFEDIRDYWDTVVARTGAKLVIPTHWDDFFVPLHEPLRPTPQPLDEVERAMSMILLLANRYSVAVRFAPVFEPIDLRVEVAKRRPEIKAAPAKKEAKRGATDQSAPQACATASTVRSAAPGGRAGRSAPG